MKRILAAVLGVVLLVTGTTMVAGAWPQDTQHNQPYNNKPYDLNVAKWPENHDFTCWNPRHVQVVNHTTGDQRFQNWLINNINDWNHLATPAGGCKNPIWLDYQFGGPGHCTDESQWFNRIMVCGDSTPGASAITNSAWRWWQNNNGIRSGHWLADRYRIRVNNNPGVAAAWWQWSDHEMDVVFCHELGHALGLWHANYSCLDSVAPMGNIVGYPTPDYPGLDSDGQRLRWLYDYI